jgi:hypothetical protein
VIIQIAEPSRRTEQGRKGGADRSQSAQQIGAPLKPDKLVPGAMLKGVGQAVGRNPRQGFGIGPPRVGEVNGEQPGLHRPQACDGKALGA